jgi:hypothetical protein
VQRHAFAVWPIGAGSGDHGLDTMISCSGSARRPPGAGHGRRRASFARPTRAQRFRPKEHDVALLQVTSGSGRELGLVANRDRRRRGRRVRELANQLVRDCRLRDGARLVM